MSTTSTRTSPARRPRAPRCCRRSRTNRTASCTARRTSKGTGGCSCSRSERRRTPLLPRLVQLDPRAVRVPHEPDDVLRPDLRLPGPGRAECEEPLNLPVHVRALHIEREVIELAPRAVSPARVPVQLEDLLGALRPQAGDLSLRRGDLVAAQELPLPPP